MTDNRSYVSKAAQSYACSLHIRFPQDVTVSNLSAQAAKHKVELIKDLTLRWDGKAIRQAQLTQLVYVSSSTPGPKMNC